MIKRLLFLTAVAGVAAIALRAFVVEGIYVSSGSMEPTLPVGMHLFLDKVSVKMRVPRHGEIVVFPSPVARGRDLLKRIIGLPGDTIYIRKKRVYRNDELLAEPYVQYTRADELLEGDNLGPLVVPAGMVFVLGDNRDESGDSRDWKDAVTGEHHYFIPIGSIKGRVLQLV